MSQYLFEKISTVENSVLVFQIKPTHKWSLKIS